METEEKTIPPALERAMKQRPNLRESTRAFFAQRASDLEAEFGFPLTQEEWAEMLAEYEGERPADELGDLRSDVIALMDELADLGAPMLAGRRRGQKLH